MQGIYIKSQRPKSKKAIKEAIQIDPNQISVEATSVFGDEYDGRLGDMPKDKKVSFVGPDPYSKRNFYGTIEWSQKKNAWTVK
jgi:hypothetical protein